MKRIFGLLALGVVMDKMAYATADEDKNNTEVDGGVGCYSTYSYYYNSSTSSA